jgi:hypothetical protein
LDKQFKIFTHNRKYAEFGSDWDNGDHILIPEAYQKQSEIWSAVLHEHVGGLLKNTLGWYDARMGVPISPLQAFSNLTELSSAGHTGQGCNCDLMHLDIKNEWMGTNEYRQAKAFYDSCCQGKQEVVGKSMYITLAGDKTGWRTITEARFWWRLDCLGEGNVDGQFGYVTLKKGRRVAAPFDYLDKANHPEWWPDEISPIEGVPKIMKSN